MEVALELGAALPRRATSGSCGYDLTSYEHCTISPGATKAVNTGVRVAVPTHLCAIVHGRSSLGKQGIATNTGIIDQDYRGIIYVSLRNGTNEPFVIKKGERVAQLLYHVIATPELKLVASLDETGRGEGGFGSTGKGEDSGGGHSSTGIPVAEPVSVDDDAQAHGV